MNFDKLKEPYVIILVGPPLSGKTSWINKNFSDKDVDIISRDQIVLDLYKGDNYNDAFNSVNQKQVDRILLRNMTDANKNKRNVIIDMTHMSPKRRKFNLSFFDNDYYKLAVLFPNLSDEEYTKRNSKRIEEEGKDIPLHIVKNMLSQYRSITKEEGFDKIISL